MRLYVLDNADDFHGVADKISIFNVELLSNRASRRPSSSRNVLIDNDDRPVLLNIHGIEVAPCDKLRSETLEIAGENGAVVGHDGVLFRFRRALPPVVAVPVRERVIEGQMRNHSYRIDSVIGREILLQLAKEMDVRFGLLILHS